MPTIPVAEPGQGPRALKRFWPVLIPLALAGWYFMPNAIVDDMRYVDGGGCSVECFGLRVAEQCTPIAPPHAEGLSADHREYATYELCRSICFGPTERRPGCPEPD